VTSDASLGHIGPLLCPCHHCTCRPCTGQGLPLQHVSSSTYIRNLHIAEALCPSPGSGGGGPWRLPDADQNAGVCFPNLEGQRRCPTVLLDYRFTIGPSTSRCEQGLPTSQMHKMHQPQLLPCGTLHRAPRRTRTLARCHPPCASTGKIRTWSDDPHA